MNPSKENAQRAIDILEAWSIGDHPGREQGTEELDFLLSFLRRAKSKLPKEITLNRRIHTPGNVRVDPKTIRVEDPEDS